MQPRFAAIDCLPIETLSYFTAEIAEHPALIPRNPKGKFLPSKTGLDITALQAERDWRSLPMMFGEAK